MKDAKCILSANVAAKRMRIARKAANLRLCKPMWTALPHTLEEKKSIGSTPMSLEQLQLACPEFTVVPWNGRYVHSPTVTIVLTLMYGLFQRSYEARRCR